MHTGTFPEGKHVGGSYERIELRVVDCRAKFQRVLSRTDHSGAEVAAACWQHSLSYVAQLKFGNRIWLVIIRF